MAGFGGFTVVVLLVLATEEALGIVKYCDQNTFTTNSSWLQLNKEASSYEYALVHRFKGLHCCAKGYRSIEWYKDGKAYPWPGGVSNLILYPESENQTIYTQMVSASDTGNYTCLLRNDTHVRRHTIHLHVFETIPDAPKITYMPQSQEVELGESVRLFCEAFVGRVDLPDAHNDASWRRPDQNGSIDDQPGVHQEMVSREDEMTLGVYLVIEKVTKDDYGEYICRINKPGTHTDMTIRLSEKMIVDEIISNPIPWKRIIIIFSVLILMVLTAVVLNMRYGLALRVWFKDHFGEAEDGDGKHTDVLICYSQKDAEIVLGVLMPKLESKYHYKCSSREFSSNVNYWHVEMAEAARKTRRIIAVLSPASLNQKWDTGTLYQAMKQLQALGPPLTCVPLQSFPNAGPQLKNAQGETLATVLRGVRVVPWLRTQTDLRFWLALRLGMPPRRRHTPASPTNSAYATAAAANATRLNSNSRESLEILV